MVKTVKGRLGTAGVRTLRLKVFGILKLHLEQSGSVPV